MRVIKFLFLFFFFFFSNTIFANADCAIQFCSQSTPPMHFPFGVKSQQQENCSYPGFELSCNNQNQTVLKLPNSGEFVVNNINYVTQAIEVYDPQNCLPQRLLDFNLSGSPYTVSYKGNYTILSCPSEVSMSRFVSIECLSNSTDTVLAITSMSAANSTFASCKFIANVSVPDSLLHQHDNYFSSDLGKSMLLYWTKPDCRYCEVQGGLCGFSSNSSQQIRCSFSDDSGRYSGSALRVFRVICFSITLPAITCAFGIAFFFFLTNRHGRHHHRDEAEQNEVPPQSTITVGLDEVTIQSYKKFILGESKRVPGHDDSTCAICLTEYTAKETLRCMPDCEHCFHADCIDVWLRVNSTCPVCRNSPLGHRESLRRTGLPLEVLGFVNLNER
ncbi:Zinc finger, RING-type [Dillenia turbinata]|uniref:Zinc finger, RING-type n=1 Tax=Dillenia turbinata TaxID=194707 RepID=A0AAN8UYT5_9MAGN